MRELAALARYIIQTYPDYYKLFGEKEYTWNKIRQPNRSLKDVLGLPLSADWRERLQQQA